MAYSTNWKRASRKPYWSTACGPRNASITTLTSGLCAKAYSQSLRQDFKSKSTWSSSCNVSLSDELNTFCFDINYKEPVIKRQVPPGDQVLTLSTAEVRITLRKVNTCISAGPDGIPGLVLRACADLLSHPGHLQPVTVSGYSSYMPANNRKTA